MDHKTTANDSNNLYHERRRQCFTREDVLCEVKPGVSVEDRNKEVGSIELRQEHVDPTKQRSEANFLY